MVKIYVKDQVGRCYSNEDGLVINKIIQSYMVKNEIITISFKGIDGVTSSFVNTAFIELLNVYDFDKIKKLIRFVDTNSQINSMIKDRFIFEVNRRNNLVVI